jgi:hypothetical protein
LKGKWTLSDPCFPISALPHQLPRSGLGSGPLRRELAITRLDWSLAPIPRSGERIARQNPFEPPLGFRLASPCPGIDRLVSSVKAMTSGPFRPCAWFLAELRAYRFPFAYGFIALRLATTIKLPGPCFETERATLVLLPRTVASQRFPSGGIYPSGLHTSVTVWFQALFTPIPGYFSVFRHRTSALSVLSSI